MIVGPQDSGKNKIAQCLEQSEEPIRKVANIMFYDRTIIVPESYLERSKMRKHIISIQQSADQGIFAQPIEFNRRTYPPNFGKSFRIPVYGVLTYHKSYDESYLTRARDILLSAGVKEVKYKVDLDNQEDLQKLMELLN